MTAEIKEKPVQKQSFIKRVMKTTSTRDAIFLWFALYVIFPGSVYFLFVSYNIYKERKQFSLEHPEFPYSPDIRYLGIAILTTIIVYTVREYTVNNIFMKKAEKMVLPIPSKSLRKKKVYKSAFAMYRTIWYVSITLFGYYCLKDEEWLPKLLGGKASFQDLAKFWVDLPYQKQEKKVMIYYMIQLGNALCTYLSQFKNRSRNSYGEFLLHDEATITLLLLSFLNNYLRMGAVILILHDISDIFSYSCKIVVDTKHIYLTLAAFIGLITSWIYTRLYIFPFHVILQCFTNNIWARPELVGYTVIAICLIALLCLHVYWFFIFVAIGKKFIVTGEADDMQDGEKTEDFRKSKMSKERNMEESDENLAESAKNKAI